VAAHGRPGMKQGAISRQQDQKMDLEQRISCELHYHNIQSQVSIFRTPENPNQGQQPSYAVLVQVKSDAIQPLLEAISFQPVALSWCCICMKQKNKNLNCVLSQAEENPGPAC
jgi:hypothetical protein